MRVLGIETSCDETGIAVYDGTEGLLADTLYSQVALHAPFGGVVPELASRDHIQKTLPLIRETLTKAQTKPKQIDAIAYTAGPGLIGALLVGASIAKSLAYAWNSKSIGMHHLESHLLAALLEAPAPDFPFLALLVSGGHTLIAVVEKLGCYKILGQSVDDAAGEAFDKTAKILGLGYPGGPALARLAERGKPSIFCFPRPMTQKKNLDFSFSGLKTSVIQTLKQQVLDESTKADIAYAFQEAVIDTLIIKCQWALKQTRIKKLVVAGGVGANQSLRVGLTTALNQMGGQVFFPRPNFCTDNGAMVAFAGYLRLKNANHDTSLEIAVKPRWALHDLS